MSSRYVENIPHILATLQGQTNGDQSQQDQPVGETETIHIYPVAGGGIFLTKNPIEKESQEPPIVESDTPTRPLAQPQHRNSPRVLHCILLLFLFLLLDSAGGILNDLSTPTATITITPKIHTVSVQGSVKLGTLLNPITLSESETVSATGHGHQDATYATGTLTLYNGLFTSQFIAQGAVFTGSDGIQVATDQAVTIPANAPPVDGQATVTAHALKKGASGNIATGDITITINNGLLVRNNQFSGGQDSRDFTIVTKKDLDAPAATLQTKVTDSMTAALQQQRTPTEQLQKVPCTPTVTANHAPEEEAQTVTVTVSETCTAIAYDISTLQAKAMQLLTAQVVKTVGKGYMVYGNISVTITKATTTQKIVVLSFSTYGTWVYHINGEAIQALVSGKPRRTALQLLTHLRGVKRASISGVDSDQQLPTDLQHIHLLIVFLP